MTQTSNTNIVLSPALARHLDLQLQHMQYRAEVTRHAISEGAATHAHASFRGADMVSWDAKVSKMLDDVDEDTRREFEAFVSADARQTLEHIGQLTQESYVKSLEQLAQIPTTPSYGLRQEVENAVLRLLAKND